MYKFKKRITFLVSNYFSICGGAEKQINNIANRLDTLGYEVTIITRNNKSTKDELVKVNNLNILSVYIGESKLKKYIYCFKCIKFLFKYPPQQSIIASQYGSNYIIAVLYSIMNKTNIIVRGSGKEIELIYENLIGKVFLKILSKRTDYFVAINKSLERTLIKVLGQTNLHKVKYITSSVSYAEQVDICKNKNILCISRIEHIKGIDILLEVWELLEARNYNIPLVIVGEGSEKKNLMDKYKFLNSVTWEEETPQVDKYIEEARIVITTSRYEGISNSLLESMSKGVPVIATNNYGNEELIEANETGILTSFKTEEIFDEIIKLYNNQDKLCYIAKNSINYIRKKRNINDMVKKYIDIIER